MSRTSTPQAGFAAGALWALIATSAGAGVPVSGQKPEYTLASADATQIAPVHVAFPLAWNSGFAQLSPSGGVTGWLPPPTITQAPAGVQTSAAGALGTAIGMAIVNGMIQKEIEESAQAEFAAMQPHFDRLNAKLGDVDCRLEFARAFDRAMRPHAWPKIARIIVSGDNVSSLRDAYLEGDAGALLIVEVRCAMTPDLLSTQVRASVELFDRELGPRLRTIATIDGGTRPAHWLERPVFKQTLVWSRAANTESCRAVAVQSQRERAIQEINVKYDERRSKTSSVASQKKIEEMRARDLRLVPERFAIPLEQGRACLISYWEDGDLLELRRALVDGPRELAGGLVDVLAALPNPPDDASAR